MPIIAASLSQVKFVPGCPLFCCPFNAELLGFLLSSLQEELSWEIVLHLLLSVIILIISEDSPNPSMWQVSLLFSIALEIKSMLTLTIDIQDSFLPSF